MENVYHYPPELFELVVDALSVLSRSKQGVIDFMRGAGVEHCDLQDVQQLVFRNRNAISKAEIARRVLTRINERRSNSGLRVRRELLKRITGFESFSLCWPKDQAKARGLVAQVREVVNQKDAFTRMQIERHKERQRVVEAAEANQREKEQARKKRTEARDALYRLFGEKDSAKRGRQLERALTQLFEAHGVSVLEPFQLHSHEGYPVEQIDGFISLDGRHYLVEAKWRDSPVGREMVTSHLMRVFTRPQADAIFITASKFTEGALAVCREAFQQGRLVIVCMLQEIIRELDTTDNLRDYLQRKVRAAIARKEPEASL